MEQLHCFEIRIKTMTDEDRFGGNYFEKLLLYIYKILIDVFKIFLSQTRKLCIKIDDFIRGLYKFIENNHSVEIDQSYATDFECTISKTLEDQNNFDSLIESNGKKLEVKSLN